MAGQKCEYCQKTICAQILLPVTVVEMRNCTKNKHIYIYVHIPVGKIRSEFGGKRVKKICFQEFENFVF